MEREESHLENWRQAFKEEELLEYAAKCYGVEPEAIRKLGGFENIVYKFTRRGEPYILRVTHDSRRSTSEIEAELDWVHDLAERGVSVARPIHSDRGTLLETIGTKQGTFLLSVCEEAPGGRVDAKHPAWGPDLFAEWGFVTGQMHACAREDDHR